MAATTSCGDGIVWGAVVGGGGKRRIASNAATSGFDVAAPLCGWALEAVAQSSAKGIKDNEGFRQWKRQVRKVIGELGIVADTKVL